MVELELLKSLWKERTKRSTTLIVPKVEGNQPDNARCSLFNEHWAFTVGYGFRDALDISYEKRMFEKKPYLVWTQGPIIAFKEGDLITSKCGKMAVQVTYAVPMGWDTDSDEMYLGIVTYKNFAIRSGKFELVEEKSSDQMQFLGLLISGEI